MCGGYKSQARELARPTARRIVPRKSFLTRGAGTAQKAPQTHYADAGDQSAAIRDKSPPSETVRENRDAAKSATPPKTSGGIKLFHAQAHAVPSAFQR